MLNLTLGKTGPLRVLCLGAHCDDIEIGCGGTILKLATMARRIEVHWVVFSSSEERKKEALKSASLFLCSVATKKVFIDGLRDGFFPYIGGDLKDRINQIKAEVSPDLILTHYRHDLHQDHRLVSELTWNTFRDHLILEYEIPKYDGDLGSPNLFVPLEESVVRTKVDGIVNCFPSQSSNHWFSEEVFMSILRLRGIECNAPSGFAEGFHCRKIVI